ncbi:cytosolic 5'-nucleotidase 1A [Engraulis encrasicolus]|uniref:cytosolic 5'-nucleotidase 1A n=1 Tax=Engraulis encrasicolus TaxID=184585 RepID=UPI002FD20A44
MEPEMIPNTHIAQMGSDTFEIAVSCHAIFDMDVTSDPLSKGVAFSFIKAIQVINEKLTVKNPKSPLFDVILVVKDLQNMQSKIVSSTQHYGLQISRFFFCSSDNFTQSLKSTNVKLFLSTHTTDVCCALQEGVPAALLCPQSGSPAEGDKEPVGSPLKVLLSGDAMALPEERLSEVGFSQPELQTFRVAKASMTEFASAIAEMRKCFDREDSPLRVALMTVLGTRNEMASALLTARDWGLEVDEAYCLAGAPHAPLLSCIQPHILCYDGLYNVTEMVPALS